MTSLSPIPRPQQANTWGSRAMRNPRSNARRYDPSAENLRTGLGDSEGRSEASELPDQSGNSGKVLKTNGNDAFWGSSSGGSVALTTEVPSGTVNGSNVTFTTTNAPTALLLFVGGVFQTGGGVDYTLSGNTITMNVAPETGTNILAIYTTASGLTAEVPTGSVNGSNKTFTLSSTPAILMLFVNGVFQTGGSVDYSLSGGTITMNVAPDSGSNIYALYTT